jgi:hypothetical protein
LISEGINAYVYDEYFAQLFWHLTQAIGWVRVTVANEDLETARAHYGEYTKALNDGPPVVEEVRRWPIVLVVSVVLGVPFILFGRKSFYHNDGNP